MPTMFKVSSGLVRGKALTRIQRTSPSFTEAPVVCGKPLKIGSHMFITLEQRNLMGGKLVQLLKSESVTIEEMDTKEEIREMVKELAADPGLLTEAKAVQVVETLNTAAPPDLSGPSTPVEVSPADPQVAADAAEAVDSIPSLPPLPSSPAPQNHQGGKKKHRL